MSANVTYQRRSVAAVVIGCLFAACLVVPARAAAPAAHPAQAKNIVHQRVQAIFDQVQSDGDFDAGAAAAEALFDQVVAYAGPTNLEAFREADFARRLLHQLAQVDTSVDRAALLKSLRKEPALSHTLVFLIRREDKLTGVYQLIAKLQAKRGKQVERYASLAAAIAVVHDEDEPFSRHINENFVTAPKPLALFDYYVKNESRMLFGIRNVPAQLLIYVVDDTASVPEMNWAGSHFAGDRQVGKLFFKIKYDYNALHYGASAKAVDKHGYNLPNILQYGGVCADQAYFATSVGKAIGVPTAYTVGRSSTVGHAWVGYFQNVRGVGLWNFSTGRYKAYQGVRGSAMNPQTRRWISSNIVALTGQLIRSSEKQREIAVAVTDGARRLAQVRRRHGAWPPQPLVKPDRPTDDSGSVVHVSDAATGSDAHPASHKQASGKPAAVRHRAARAKHVPWLDKPRAVDAQSELDLLEAGLSQCPGDAQGWLAVADLAKAGRMTLAQKTRWSEVLLRMCGRRYPDFVLTILEPMIASVSDPEQQNALWNKAFTFVRNRFDLAAAVRMHQGAMWEKAGQLPKAGQCYLDVIRRYANAGPFVVDALKHASDVLEKMGRGNSVLALYQQTWASIHKPEDYYAEFEMASNWYRVGRLFEKRLKSAGNAQAAAKVHALINKTIGIKG